MKTYNILAGLVIFALVSACSLMEVQHRYEPNVAFSTYKNYSWIQIQPEEDTQPEIDPEMDSRIRSQINKELAGKGFSEIPAEQADFLVNYRFLTQERSALVQDDVYIRQRNYVYADSLEAERYDYRVGSLILDVIDSKSREVVWQGNIYGFLDVHSDPKKQQERLEKAVRMLLSKFPP